MSSEMGFWTPRFLPFFLISYIGLCHFILFSSMGMFMISSILLKSVTMMIFWGKTSSVRTANV